MTKCVDNFNQDVNFQVNDTISTTDIGIYTVYDCVLQQFSAPVSLPKQKVKDYYTLLVNDVQSPYYNHESDYILDKIGSFDIATGEIQLHYIERICVLDMFIDYKRRNLQTLLQTLNYFFLFCRHFKISSRQKIQSL